ncbi:hypothetical protein GCM10025868_25230 [Angustibacter aerolatus]|uniref:Uncharacterized protein n=1 Tax=Angustibacter aerolatus TaxID=1162965 RepID=A0ABQ6JIP5_9ACTN|nr:hypothetical protein GCM10025868_25230 [Angustibacter aerolatus]
MVSSLQRDGGAPQGLHGRDHLLRLVGSGAVGEDDVGAGGREGEHGRAAEAAVAAGDECDLRVGHGSTLRAATRRVKARSIRGPALPAPRPGGRAPPPREMLRSCP